MVKHSTLTGVDLHEPKGVATATTGAIAQAVAGAINWDVDITPESVILSTTKFTDQSVSLGKLPAGAAAPTLTKIRDNGAGSTGVFSYVWAGSGTAQYLSFDLQMPHSIKRFTALRPHIHWCTTTGTAGDVVWQLEYTLFNAGNLIPVTTLISTDPVTNPGAYISTVTSFPSIAGTNVKESTVLLCRITRDTATDTYADGAAALYVDFHYEIEKFGTDVEFPV